MPAFQPWKLRSARHSQKLVRRHEARWAQRNILAGQRLHFRQQPRFYLDICHKYSFSPADGRNLVAFWE